MPTTLMPTAPTTLIPTPPAALIPTPLMPGPADA